MKGNLSGMWRSGVALLLVLCMVVGLVPATAFATQVPNETTNDLDKDGNGIIEYVSFGASNTNGYGHRGYLPEEVTEDPLAASKADLNTYGYKRTPAAAYPAQIAAELERIYGDVNLNQLAISSMRTEELSFLLDDSWAGDAYTQWRFTGGQNWFSIAEPGGLEKLRQTHREAIENAELITIDIGWNNFGVYAFNNIKDILAKGNFWKAPDFDEVMDKDEQINYANLKQYALNYLTDNTDMTDPVLLEKLDKIADVLTYTTMGACHHFDIIMGKIYELNPEVTVVAINIQNLADGLIVEFEGTELKLGELYGKLIEMVDLYRATACPYADQYIFADAGDIDTFLDEILAWDGDPVTLTDDMKDCFDMYDDDLYVRSIVEYMMVGQALSGVFASVRNMGSEYDMQIFQDDDKYIYEFALDTAWLNGVDLGSLNLVNPETELEKYGAAVAKHLKNLRAEDYDAYDYAFENLIKPLQDQLEQVKAGLALDEYNQELLTAKANLEYAIALIQSAQTQFKTALKGVFTSYQNTLNYAYDVVATVVQAAARIESIEVNANSLSGFGTASDQLMEYISDNFVSGATSKFYYELQKNGVMETGVTEDPIFEMDSELLASPSVAAIAVLAVRYMLGNSFYAHPNTAGNDQITEAVLEALENGTTAKDFSNAQFRAAWNWLLNYAKEHYPEDRTVFDIVAEYVDNEAFDALSALLERMYKKLDSVSDFEEKKRLAKETYVLITRMMEVAAMTTAKETEPTYYVSIGDSTLSGYGLDEYIPDMNNGEDQVLGTEAPVLLAQKLFGEQYEAYFEKLDKGGLRVDDLLVWLGEDSFIDDFYIRYTMDANAVESETAYYQNRFVSEIQKADLITLALGGGNITTFVNEQMDALARGDEPYEMDWSKYFSDVHLTEIRECLAVIQKLLEGKLPEIKGVPAEKLAPVVAESILFGLIGYMHNYPRVLARIHEINPDAQLVVVSYFNPIDEMVFPVTIGDETIEIPVGTMLGTLMESCNAVSLKYALEHKENTVFVSVKDTTTILEERGQNDLASQLNGLFEQTWLTHAGSEGHQYIADRIYTAITTQYTSEDIVVAAMDVFSDYVWYLADEFGDEMMASAEYTIRPDSSYVALGDSTAVTGGYVELLAAELAEISGSKYASENLAKDGLMIQDINSVLEENALLMTNADFVTLGFGNNGFTNFAIEQITKLIDQQTIELDWSIYLSEEDIHYVETVKTELYTLMEHSGMDGDHMGVNLADLLVVAIESYAYSYAAYVYNLPEVVDAIHEMNPDALVVIIGMYNPLADVVIEVGDEKLDIGNYLQKLVDATNMDALMYAMLSGDALYVDAPEVETSNKKSEMNVFHFMMEFLYNKAKSLNPTEAGHTYIKDQILNALTVKVHLGHTWDAGVVTDATCTEDGYIIYTCACGETYVDNYTDALGHSYEAVVTAPTCTEDGYTTYTCSVCGDSYVGDEVAVLGHSYEAVVTAPTCTENGYTTYTCSVCGDSYVGDEVAVLGHSYEAVVTAPTCTENGYTTYTCSVCGDSYVGDEVAALGHSYEAVVTAPTCTEDGYTTYTCACGDSYVGDEVAALGHTEGEIVTENIVAATCTTAGSYDTVVCCAVCDLELSRETVVVAALGHSYESEVTAPTCTEGGYTTYTCTACDDSYFADETDALGHSWNGLVCENCNATRENPFTDVPVDSFYMDAVLWAVEEGITTGATETTFNPTGDLLRAQVVTMLWRHAGAPVVVGVENPFTDISESDWYYNAVLWAVEQGITTGTSVTEFSPYGVTNRAQTVTFLWRYLSCPAATAGNAFEDVVAGEWYEAPINWAVENGVTNGIGDGLFGINANCNRAHMVTFLYRALAE